MTNKTKSFDKWSPNRIGYRCVVKIGDIVKPSNNSTVGKILDIYKCHCKTKEHDSFLIRTWDGQEIIWHGKVEKFSF